MYYSDLSKSNQDLIHDQWPKNLDKNRDTFENIITVVP